MELFNIKNHSFIMKRNLKKFQVEELEQRFETGRWIDSVKVSVSYEGVGGGVTFDGPV